jgi:SAM-dependent methyltransferase
MQRRSTPELLDDDLGTPAEIAASLQDLQHINDWFGGTRTTIRSLLHIAQKAHRDSLSLLELGAGSGRVPITAREALRRRGVDLRITLLDRASSHLPVNGVPAVAADALRLPFRDGAFDVVACNLVAHHFQPDGLRQLAAEALRVARTAVLINDVVRSRLHLALTYAGLPLFRSRLTWHDAPASVRQAYTPGEMCGMLDGIGARKIEVSRHYLYRMAVLLWK